MSTIFKHLNNYYNLVMFYRFIFCTLLQGGVVEGTIQCYLCLWREIKYIIIFCMSLNVVWVKKILQSNKITTYHSISFCDSLSNFWHITSRPFSKLVFFLGFTGFFFLAELFSFFLHESMWAMTKYRNIKDFFSVYRSSRELSLL